MTIEITGKITGTGKKHTDATLKATWDKAFLVLPEGSEPVVTTPQDAKTTHQFPVILFMHGSSGVNDQIKLFAKNAAKNWGVAVVVPDAMQLPDRMMYSSPIARADYEVIHALRSEELTHAVACLKTAPWFNGNFVIAGTSEGGVCVARHDREKAAVKEAGRMIFSWSCEANYHVEAPRNNIPSDLPVLNVMSLTDKFFSRANTYLDNPEALGYSAEALRHNTVSTIALIPDAPHTLFNLPQAQGVIKAFLDRVLLK